MQCFLCRSSCCAQSANYRSGTCLHSYALVGVLEYLCATVMARNLQGDVTYISRDVRGLLVFVQLSDPVLSRFGIFVGDGKVIHFTRGQGQELGTGTALDTVISGFGSSPSHAHTACNQCSSNAGKSGVIVSCIDCFLCGYPLYRFEYGENTVIFLAKARGGTCTLAVSDSPEKVLHRANYLLENGFGIYHIFRKNCEDFAMYCKTGLLIVEGNAIGISGQACSFLGAPLAAVASSPLGFVMAEPWGLVALSAGMYYVSRYASDLRNRWDVTRVPVESLVTKVAPAVCLSDAER